MRPLSFLGVLIVGVIAILLGCSQEPRERVEAQPDRPVTTLVPADNPGDQPPLVQTGDRIVRPVDIPLVPVPELSVQEKYDAALLDALNQLADKKYSQALAALEAARALNDTEQVRLEIDKVKGLIDQQAAAEKAAQDIQTVLAQGKSDEAGQLATDALKQFGATDAAEPLTTIKRQADAITATQLNDDPTRRDRFRQEGEAALRENNLRAAAIAFETSLQYGDQDTVRRQLDDIRSRLTRYDEGRQRALALRRNAAQLEDAIAALQDAAQAWDTLQIHQDLDECNLLLQKRRESLTVADFEVRGDLGMPLAGRTIAEELLPYFKPRYDLVERGQLGRVIDELKLEASDLVDNHQARQQLGQLAKVRYLVVGSITPLNGILVNARLVDIRTGLIVQSARLVVATPEEMLGRLRQLANVLMMTDEQMFAYETQQAQRAVEDLKPVVVAPLPPPPPPPVAGQPLPPPILVFSPRPPVLGGLVIDDFRALPPPPPLGDGLAIGFTYERDDPYRQRSLSLAVELGDNLFRRGRYREAHRHFELALRLGGGGVDLSLRIDRCRPYLPPPPPPPPPPVFAPGPVVVQDPLAPPPVVVVAPPPRPRLVVFNFVVSADPGLVPPSFGDWASDHFASCFGGTYEIVDRGEVCWYMGRLGITMRDILTNPGARIALAQSLNVRFFAYGFIQQTASFNVTTHLIDAETGARHGGGDIHVQDHQELKLRMHELVKQTVAKPDEQAKIQQEGKENEKLLNDARRLYQAGKFNESAQKSREGLKRMPNSVAFQTLLQQSEQAAQKAAIEESAKKEAARAQAEAAAAKKRQDELARQAEGARLRTEQENKAKDAAARRAQEQQKLRAYGQLVAQARTATQQGRHAQAVALLESAAALQPSDGVSRDLAQAKAKLEEAKKTQAAQDQAAREAAQRKQREQDLAAAKAKVEDERKRREAEDAARRREMETRDQAQAARLIEQGKQQLAKQQFDASLAAFGAARQLYKTDEVERLLTQAVESKARLEAQKKGDQAKAEFEKKLVEEKAQRDQADAEAKHKQQAYVAALEQAHKALLERRFGDAIAKYQEADKFFHTDAVITGLKQAQDGQARALVQAEADKQKKVNEQQHANEVKRLLTQGQAALNDKQYDKAVQFFSEAKKLAPTNAEVLTALSKAEQTRTAEDARLAGMKEKEQEMHRAEQVRQLVSRARDALSVKRFDDAAKALTEASRLAPRDPSVIAAQRDLEQGRAAMDAEAKKKDDAQKRLAEYNRLMKLGQAAMSAKRYDEAVKSYADALKLMPGDVAATRGQRDATAMMDAARADAEKQKRQADYQAAMKSGRDALAAKRFDDAIKAFTDAGRLVPNDRDATTALRDAQKARADAQARMDADLRKKQEDQKRQADYARLMTQGQTAMAAKRYDEAVKAYNDALKLMPGDAAATRALGEATRAHEASKTPPKPAPPPAAYTRSMQNGAAFDKQQKWADAVKWYKEALKAVPGDAKGTAAESFSQHMDNGQKLAAAKKFADAAKEYEAALKLVPNQPDAASALKRAKEGKP
jgi:tetratricopeptide (TPR) repeat protein